MVFAMSVVRSLLWYSLAAALLILCVIILPVQAEEQPYQILILNSYNPGLFFSDREVVGVQDAFRGVKAEFTLEYMDSKRITTPAYRQLLLDSYRMKYADTRFDAIISLDDDAFQFLLTHADTLFPETPVFFCGVNNFDDAMLAGHPQFTGVVETLSRNETMDLALKLHPGTERILVVTDQTSTGEINRKTIEGIVATGRFSVPVIFIDEDRKGLSLQELKEKLREALPGSVVYYSDFFQDKEGKTYPPGEVMKEITAVSTVPVYAHGDQYLGYGVVGGKMNSGLLQGEKAAKMALANLSGTPVSAIPVYKEGMTGYMFDENIVRRWNIPLSALPPDARIMNHVESPLEKYGLYLAAIALFILLETWIIIALLVSRRNRIRVETELRSTDATLRSLISANPETVILIDPSGRILYCNEVAASRLGSTPDQLLGKDMFTLVPSDIAERRKAMLDEVISTGKTVRAHDPRNDTIFISTYTPIRGPDGRIERIAILAVDVTESQRLQETLSRINRKLKNLAEITRTDLANRAFVTQGYVDLLRTEPPEGKRQEYLKKLKETLDSLVLAITISRQYQDLGARLPVWLDVNKTFLFALSHISTMEIRHELPAEQYEIFADPNLENALLSLIRLTITGTTSATKIRLSAIREKDSLLLLYEDNGFGIPKKEQLKFFRPEYPEYRALFIAKEILDVTGISIRENGDGNSGLRFEIRVPPGLFRLSQQ